MTLAPGQTLGKYRIEAEIGRGGMGIVYRAYDPTLRRVVAIKVLPPQLTTDPEFVQRFRQEAIVAASLHHPGIVTIFDVGEEQGAYFIVMEYLEGATLDHWIASRGALPLPEVERIVRQVAAALDYAHERGVVHRDVKPANIMVCRDGRITLMDFGLVRAGEGTRLTRAGTLMGTPEYMSPEQAIGAAVDHRSDVYSLGVVAYRMLSGTVPFTRSTPLAITYAHVHDAPPPLRTLRGDLSPAIETVVGRALTKRPETRYQRAGQLAADLTRVIAGERRLTPPGAPPPVPQPSSARAKGASRLPWILAGSGLLLLVAVAVGFVLAASRGGEPPAAAPPTAALGLVVENRPTSTLVAIVTSPPAGLPTGLPGGRPGGDPTGQAAATAPTVAAVEPTNAPPPATNRPQPTATRPAATQQPAASPTRPAPTSTSKPPQPTLPAPTATKAPAQPAARPTSANCRPWHKKPKAGYGIVMIENHLGDELSMDYVVGGSGNWMVPAKQGDEPGRWWAEVPAGTHVLNYSSPRYRGRATFEVVAGQSYTSPLWLNERSEDYVYPMDIPADCR